MKKKTVPKSKKIIKKQVRKTPIHHIKKIKNKILRNQKAFVMVAVLAVGTLAFVPFIALNKSAAPKRFAEKPASGLVYKGLVSNKKSKVCKGDKLLEVKDKKGKIFGCTHGPDPAPAGIDVRQNTVELATEVSSDVPQSWRGVVCDGDGVSGNRVEFLYVHASDKPDRLAELSSHFNYMGDSINDTLITSSWKTGKTLSFRFAHDANCDISVKKIKVSSTGDDTLGNTISEVQAQGYNRADRKYVMWVDANVYCGVAQMYLDDRPGQDNANNKGPSYSRVDSACWYSWVEQHEIMHMLGAVQDSAPHSTKAGHCYDEDDSLCYQDTASTVLKDICNGSWDELRFDCNNDDYFHTNPAAGSYLANYWNTARNKFLFAPDIPVGDPDLTPPVISITSPAAGSMVRSSVKVTGKATDNKGISKVEFYVDGQYRATSGGGNFSARVSFNKLAKGQHVITATAFDYAGNATPISVNVIKR